MIRSSDIRVEGVFETPLRLLINNSFELLDELSCGGHTS